MNIEIPTIIEPVGKLQDYQDKEYRQNERNRKINVICATLAIFFTYTYTSVNMGTMFDAFVFILYNNKNVWVGLIEGTSGIASLLICLPAGIITDYFPKHLLIRALSIPILTYLTGGILTVLFKKTYLFFIYAIFFGVSFELIRSVLYTTILNSLKREERVKYMTIFSSCGALGFAFAPFISALFFIAYHNSWELRDLTILMLASTCLFGPILALICLFGFYPINLEMIENSKSTKDNLNMREDTTTALLKNDEDVLSEQKRIDNLPRFARHIPLFIGLQKFVICLGKGMVLKFSPLFLKQEYGFSPTMVNLQSLILPIASIICMFISSWLAPKLGRPQTSLLMIAISGFCLIAVTYLQDIYILLPLLILRHGSANAVDAIDTSMLSDYTRAKNRGKWLALISLGSTAWSGSAFIGGFIADNNSYRKIFLTSAVFTFISLIFYILIILVIPKDDKKKSFQK